MDWLMHLSKNVLTTDTAAAILRRFDSLTEEEDFAPKLQPSTGVAFSGEVIATILLGVITGVLTEQVKRILFPKKPKAPATQPVSASMEGLLTKAKEARRGIV